MNSQHVDVVWLLGECSVAVVIDLMCDGQSYHCVLLYGPKVHFQIVE